MKSNILVLIIALLIVQIAKAQTQISTKEINFGDLNSTTQRYADITIRNPGKSKVYLLRIEHSPDLVYRINREEILPDSTFVVRFQVNPKAIGQFSHVARIFLSDQPDAIQLKLIGNVTELPPSNNYLTNCPDFGTSPPKTVRSQLTIITVDKDSGKPLSRTSVAIIRNGKPAGAWITGNKGSFQETIPSGYFYFLAAHEGYLKKEAGVYVGPEISEITIPMSKDSMISIVETPLITPPEITEEATPISSTDAAVLIDEQMKNEQTDSVIQKELPALATIPLDNFSDDYFKAVNVVFVLDISSSMKIGERMNLMKYALNQLVGSLRPKDLMGIVTYSESASVFQTSTPCDRKEILSNSIEKLKPEGLTAGGRGIKLGYKEVMRNFDSEKTNLVIVITDGAFNKDSDDYQKTVRKYTQKGVVFSVVGVQARARDAVQMEEAARFGNGRYIPIQKLSDAQFNLLQEIRIASFKGI